MPVVHYDACLQNSNIGDESTIFLIAPSEGQTSLSLFKDTQAEVMAFSTLFPNGLFGFASERPISISLKNMSMLGC